MLKSPFCFMVSSCFNPFLKRRRFVWDYAGEGHVQIKLVHFPLKIQKAKAGCKTKLGNSQDVKLKPGIRAFYKLEKYIRSVYKHHLAQAYAIITFFFYPKNYYSWCITMYFGAFFNPQLEWQLYLNVLIWWWKLQGCHEIKRVIRLQIQNKKMILKRQSLRCLYLQPTNAQANFILVLYWYEDNSLQFVRTITCVWETLQY